MTDTSSEQAPGDAGAFGVNYALRPHKFVDRRVFLEVINRYSTFNSVHSHVYVGLGSFAMEDHKLISAAFGLEKLISLEIDASVLDRQKFNVPLASIKPTLYSTNDFVTRKNAIFQEFDINAQANSIVWFDMTDHNTLRANLDEFRELLRSSEPGDVLRITVDIDEKTLGRRHDGETLPDLSKRRFAKLQEFLAEEMKLGARPRQLESRLGIAKLATYAFGIIAEQAFATDRKYKFEPISLTTYADGHRMLSITGIVIERDAALSCRTKMNLSTVPGGAVTGWDSLVEIQIPQLTIWEKLYLDREFQAQTTRQLANKMNFRLHETISTIDLLKGYSDFQRFYPTFRHVLL